MAITRNINIPKNISFFLLGPRQTGKTTLLRQSFPPETTLTINLLDQRALARYAADPELLKSDVMARPATVSHVVIDEVQKLPSLLDVVHNILEDRNPPFFVLTGSSARRLRRENANMLGARAIERQLFPLTHIELGDDFDLVRALSRGTLPRFYLEPDTALFAEMVQTYVSIYLTEEIQHEAKIRAIGPFSRFLLAAAGLLGEQINYSAIARDTGTADKTIREYYQILEDTLIGFFLPAFARSTRKKLAKHPKFFFFDPGVARSILGQESARLLPGTTIFGALFELWVINETKRLLSYAGIRANFSFFRLEKVCEVDLIIEFLDKRVWAIEIKSAPNVSLADVRDGFTAIKSIAHVDRCIVVCTATSKRVIDDVEFMPWQEFFRELAPVRASPSALA